MTVKLCLRLAPTSLEARNEAETDETVLLFIHDSLTVNAFISPTPCHSHCHHGR